MTANTGSGARWRSLQAPRWASARASWPPPESSVVRPARGTARGTLEDDGAGQLRRYCGASEARKRRADGAGDARELERDLRSGKSSPPRTRALLDGCANPLVFSFPAFFWSGLSGLVSAARACVDAGLACALPG